VKPTQQRLGHHRVPNPLGRDEQRINGGRRNARRP